MRAETPVAALLRREITAGGPITVARFMELCLSHPEHGYYITRDPLGAAGDFTTAPEINQMFGEIVGAWIAAVAPVGDPLRLVELGPGRGTLMSDMQRVLARGGRVTEPWLVETSLALRAKQAEQVAQAKWADGLAHVPRGPAVIVANEFLDALPVRQFLATPEGWRERVLGLVADDLAWGLSEPLPGRKTAENGAWREMSPAADAVLSEIGQRVAGGAVALIIDYGYELRSRPAGPTLQAVREHARVDTLTAPGECDLTWLIDFDAIGRVLSNEGAVCHQAPQGAFLARLGIGQRAAMLARAHPDHADAIADALERLTAPAQMGTLFRVLAAVPAGAPTPPGFEDPV